MEATTSKIRLVVLFFLISSPLSTPSAQELLETSPIQLKSTAKRLHRILVQLWSTLVEIIDTGAGNEVTIEAIREVLSLISSLDLLLNQSLIRGIDGLGSEILSTLSTLELVVSTIDESSLSLPSKVSDDLSDLLRRLVSVISSLELDITTNIVKAV